MNWQKMINELLAGGMTQVEIAQQVGCTQSFVSEVSAGKKGKKRMAYDIGMKIEKLWRDNCDTAA